MNLDEAQRKTVADWIAQGLKLSEIQSRLASEMGVKLTYMEVRLLVDDLKLTPKDVDPPKPSPTLTGPPLAGSSPSPAAAPPPGGPQPPGGPGRVSVSLDQITRAGALASGKVTFSDGQQAEWYLDQMGRLGVVPKQQGYKPGAVDVQEFQLALQDELAKAGI